MKDTDKIIDANVEEAKVNNDNQTAIEEVTAKRSRLVRGACWIGRHAKDIAEIGVGIAIGVVAKTLLSKHGKETVPETDMIQDVEPEELTTIEVE